MKETIDNLKLLIRISESLNLKYTRFKEKLYNKILSRVKYLNSKEFELDEQKMKAFDIIHYIGNINRVPENYYNLKIRKREYVRARQDAITLIIDNTKLTLQAIVEIFNMKSHSSAIDAHNKVDDRIFTDKNYKKYYYDILEEKGFIHIEYLARTTGNKP